MKVNIMHLIVFCAVANLACGYTLAFAQGNRYDIQTSDNVANVASQQRITTLENIKAKHPEATQWWMSYINREIASASARGFFQTSFQFADETHWEVIEYVTNSFRLAGYEVSRTHSHHGGKSTYYISWEGEIK